MTFPLVTASILGVITEKIFEALISKGAEQVITTGIEKLKSTKAENAFRVALGESIQIYATMGNRFALAEPLLEKNGFLTERAISDELRYLLYFDREPNYQLIGDRWKSSITESPAWLDFSKEARLFIKILKNRLMSSEVFAPVFSTYSLNSINTNAVLLVDALESIELEINNLIEMMDTKFRDLMIVFLSARDNIKIEIRDFSLYIEEKTKDFIGRRFIFDRFQSFLENNDRGYFIVKGDPGIGKTSLAAQLVKEHGYIHHFNIRSLGINNSSVFLTSICSQLITVFHLNYERLPIEAKQDSGFLIILLKEVSMRLQPREKVVIIVDSLDEVDEQNLTPGANILFLPITLPKNIYIFATSRRVDLRLRIDCEQETAFIQQDSIDNIQDIREYIYQRLKSPRIQEFLPMNIVERNSFVDKLIAKSQGNFVYLYYVLNDMERGILIDITLEGFPGGLESYYEEHWKLMRSKSENDWLNYKLPIIIALSIVREPVPVELISKFSKVFDYRRVRSVLIEWQQFLYERKFYQNEDVQKRYRVYHESFREFIASKDEVVSEHVNLINAHGIIADVLWEEFFEDDVV